MRTFSAGVRVFSAGVRVCGLSAARLVRTHVDSRLVRTCVDSRLVRTHRENGIMS